MKELTKIDLLNIKYCVDIHLYKIQQDKYPKEIIEKYQKLIDKIEKLLQEED